MHFISTNNILLTAGVFEIIMNYFCLLGSKNKLLYFLIKRTKIKPTCPLEVRKTPQRPHFLLGFFYVARAQTIMQIVCLMPCQH